MNTCICSIDLIGKNVFENYHFDLSSTRALCRSVTLSNKDKFWGIIKCQLVYFMRGSASQCLMNYEHFEKVEFADTSTES